MIQKNDSVAHAHNSIGDIINVQSIHISHWAQQLTRDDYHVYIYCMCLCVCVLHVYQSFGPDVTRQEENKSAEDKAKKGKKEKNY